MSKNIAVSKAEYVDVIFTARAIGLKVVLRELEQGDFESLAHLTLKGTAHQLCVLDKIFDER